MGLSNIGDTITLEEGKIYITMSESVNGDCTFEIDDTLDYKKNSARFLACLCKGMLELACTQPQMTVDVGVKAFVKEGFLEAAEREDFADAIEVDDSIGPVKGNA
jgi:hypothetical protein